MYFSRRWMLLYVASPLLQCVSVGDCFWYYLEEIPFAPKILPESSYPLVHTPFDDIQKCAFRVILYENRISVEFFHAITDGNGGLGLSENTGG